jgi:hypothetical protein
MKAYLLSTRMAMLTSALVMAIACTQAYAKGVQSGSVYFGSATIGAMVVADFNKDGHPDILTVDGGTGTNNFVLMGQADGTFVSKVAFTASGHLSAVVAGDFNGDGILDIAVTDSNANNVIILLGAGDGTFTTKATISTGASPVAIAAVDLNGDGKLDLVVANNPAGTITTYLGAGDGTFTAQTPQKAGAVDPVAITTGDFDGDGKVDVAVAINSNQMSILAGNGDGTLQPPLTTTIFNEVNPSDIKAVDFNGDGKLDLIVCTLGSVLFIPGNGTLSFGAPVRLATLPGHQVAIADMNGDGHPDIIVARNAAATLLINNGTGGIASSQTYHAAGFPSGIGVGDFNGDSKPDIAVASSLGSDVHVISGNGDGTLRGALHYDFQSGGCVGSAEGIVTADFNHDGLPDVAVADGCNRITVLLNDGAFNFTVVLPDNPLSATQFRMIAADMNGDGNPDLVAISNSQIFVFLGNGDGTFKAPVSTNISASGFHHIIAGDFNGDGKLDVAYTETKPPDATDTTVGILLGNGDGTFQPLNTVPVLSAGELPNGLAVGDFNNDGKLDLAVLNAGNGVTSTVSIFLGTGTGTFTAKPSLDTGAFPIDIRAVDFDKNGNLDLVVANSGNGGVGTVQAFAGNGDGTFTPTFTSNDPSITASIASMAVGDFDGDGFPDVAVWANDEVHIFRHKVAVVFDPPISLGLGDQGAELEAADLNGGGAADIVASDGTMAVLPNTGGLKVSPVTSTLNSSIFPQSTTFSAALVPSFPGHLPPLSGSLQFNDGATLLGSGGFNPSGTATFSTAALNAGTHLVSASYPGDSNYIARTLPGVSQLVNQAATSITLTSPVIAAVLGDAINFSTVTTPATSGVPTGNISLLDGKTLVGILPVDGSGDASFSISSLTAGSHSLTASYSGDKNYVASSSAAVPETIFITPDFQITASNPSLTVHAGQSAILSLNLLAARFPGPVTFSCSGLPSLAACSFSPSTLTLGTGNFSSTLTITTTASSVAALKPVRPNEVYFAAWLFPGVAGLLICFRRRRQSLARAISFLLFVLGLTFIASCGGGGGSKTIPGTPPGMYSVVVQVNGPNGTNVSHQMTVTLTVTP